LSLKTRFKWNELLRGKEQSMTEQTRPIGFIGLGFMGEPMALNLRKAGTPLMVWNRTPTKLAALAEAGAHVAPDIDSLFAAADIVILMLADEAAIDAVLARSTSAFGARVRNHVIVHMGTTPTAFSHSLETDLRAAGAQYVEAPVSGSRKPAVAGQLVAMLAGEVEAVMRVQPLLAPLCKQTVVCGAVPAGLSMKLAVNLYLLTTTAGLAEAFHFAERHGLDLAQFAAVINAGQMASDLSRVKLPKLVDGDFSVHAAIADVFKNNRFVSQAARDAGIASPLLDVCHALYAETLALGHATEDMAAVVKAIEARTARLRDR
jgi:3-hydroxyisobutyrate dehydrogenase